MEGLTTLLTVPKRTALVNLVLTNNTFLGALGKFFNEKGTLLSQVVELTQEVLVVVLDLGFIAFVFTLFLEVLNFFNCFRRFIFNILDVSSG